jgi:hypothetical protein
MITAKITLPYPESSPLKRGGRQPPWGGYSRGRPSGTWSSQESDSSGSRSRSDQDKGGEWRRAMSSGCQDESSTLVRDATVP